MAVSNGLNGGLLRHLLDCHEHLPFWWIEMQRQLKSPAGAGSQFDSFSAPDGSVLKIKTEPSALNMRASRWQMASRASLGGALCDE
jgi:hypothetical protein